MPQRSGRQSPSSNAPEQAGYFLANERAMRMGEDPVDLDDGAAVAVRCRAYMALCADSGTKPTVPGLSLALGATPEQMAAHPTAELRRALVGIESVTAQMALDGRAAMAPAIFFMKNWFSYEDTPGTRALMEARADRSEMERRYADVDAIGEGHGKGKAR